jgi:hypothetical protein
MKRINSIGILLLIFALPFILLVIYVNVANADLYGRLIETISVNSGISKNEVNKDLPLVTLILHKYLIEENAVDASIVLSYPKVSMFENLKTNKIKIVITFSDGYFNDPSGLIKIFSFTDSINNNSYGYTNIGFESGRFQIPVFPSIDGFPFDDIQLMPVIFINMNGNYSRFNLEIQKRISGKILKIQEGKNSYSSIIMTRTSTEKTLVILSSIIFILLTFILTYRLFTIPNGLNKLEELITVAGFILAIASFREILGISRNSGTSALEIFVILVPILSIFIGLTYSFFKKSINNIFSKLKNIFRINNK